MVKLSPTNLWAVEVPEDAYDFDFRRNNQIIYLVKDAINPLTGSEKSEIIDLPGFQYSLQIKDWHKIVGTVTKDEIDFDVERLVERHPNIGYRNYAVTFGEKLESWTNNWTKNNSAESFRSLLASNGLYFENPMPQPIIEDYSAETTNKEIDLYFKYEKSLVKKLLILQEIK